MAHPRDATARDEILVTWKAKIGSYIQAHYSYPEYTDAKGRPVERLIAEWITRHGGLAMLARARGTETIDNEMASIEWGGLTVGRILFRVIELGCFFPDSSINKACFLVAQEKTQNPFWRGPRSERRIREAWEQYKPAAPLWAAALVGALIQQENLPGNGPDFISSVFPQGLADFLALAELFRRVGLWLRPHGQTYPILDSTETWQIPMDLQLPEVLMTFDPLEDWILTALKAYRAPRRDY